MNNSNLDPTRPRVPCSQVLYIPSSSIDCRCPSQGCKDATVVGLQHRQEEAQEDLGSAFESNKAHGAFVHPTQFHIPRSSARLLKVRRPRPLRIMTM
jgi:hypothetical protein